MPLEAPTAELLFDPACHWVSHWQRSADRAALPLPGPLPRRVQYLIAGLGITGAATALELVLHGVPASDIAIVEAAHLAFGASGRNAGFVLSFPGAEILDWRRNFGDAGARDLILLNERNRQLVREFVTTQGLWHQAGGSYFLAASPEEGARLRECSMMLGEAGAVGFELRDRHLPAGDGFHECIHQPADLGINPVLYVAALLRASGVGYTSGCLLQPGGIATDGDGLSIQTSLGSVRADHLILASNAFSPFIDKHFATRIPITPARNQVLLARVADAAALERWGAGIYYSNEGYDYWRALPGGLFLLGGGRNHDREGEATWRHEQNPRIMRYLEDNLLPRLVGPTATVLHRWQGTLGMSPDGIPLAGVLPGFGGLVSFAVGLSGYGLGFHRVLAEALVGHLVQGKPLGLFAADRLYTTTA